MKVGRGSFLINFFLCEILEFFGFLRDLIDSEGGLRWCFEVLEGCLEEMVVELRERGVEVILIVEFFSAVNEVNYWFEWKKC